MRKGCISSEEGCTIVRYQPDSLSEMSFSVKSVSNVWLGRLFSITLNRIDKELVSWSLLYLFTDWFNANSTRVMLLLRGTRVHLEMNFYCHISFSPVRHVFFQLYTHTLYRLGIPLNLWCISMYSFYSYCCMVGGLTKNNLTTVHTKFFKGCPDKIVHELPLPLNDVHELPQTSMTLNKN